MIDLTFDHVFRQQIVWVRSCWASDLDCFFSDKNGTLRLDILFLMWCVAYHGLSNTMTPTTEPPNQVIATKIWQKFYCTISSNKKGVRPGFFFAETSVSIGVFSQIPIDPRVRGWLSPTKRGHFVQVRPHHSPISVLLTQTDVVSKAPLLAAVHSSRFFYNDCWLWSVV